MKGEEEPLEAFRRAVSVNWGPWVLYRKGQRKEIFAPCWGHWPIKGLQSLVVTGGNIFYQAKLFPKLRAGCACTNMGRARGRRVVGTSQHGLKGEARGGHPRQGKPSRGKVGLGGKLAEMEGKWTLQENRPFKSQLFDHLLCGSQKGAVLFLSPLTLHL